MARMVPEPASSRLKTIWWWSVLLGTLILVDDATFGWIFWALAQINPWLSALVALVDYWLVGYWITLQGLKPHPHKLAVWFLKRLQLERKNPEVNRREQSLKAKITSVAIATPMSLLFGGVITTLWLVRRGVIDLYQAKRVAFYLCGVYAAEFAVIHALGIGGSIFFARH
ncbi:hypothetical protein HY346_01645 [Candidatus Microgenomates bacterium]|nr:hypothetical protein [Candidatus Microgenomates bacterium]